MKSAESAMNTIPSIFNERQINHTVLGGTENPRSVQFDVDCILLNRSGVQYRTRVLDVLISKGFSRVISVEGHTDSFAPDALTRQYPSVKFILAHEDNLTQGDLLNLAMAESRSTYVLVVQDDLCSEDFTFNQKTYESLLSIMKENTFCVCPKLVSPKFSNIPVHFIPSAQKSVFRVDTLSGMQDGDKTFYASDLTAFYNRSKYVQLGGMDYTIQSEYWQKLDLFFRAWLWGESTLLSTHLIFSYSDGLPEENRTTDFSYIRFYLKNLLPVYINDHAHIPASSFFAFTVTASCGFSKALKFFKEARRWTEANKYRFKTDAQSLIENWSKNAGEEAR